jgi:gliding motility-associated-like protein
VAGGVKAYANLAQGNYIVDVRDHRDCVQSKPIAVQAPGQVPLAVVGITATDATCDNAGESGAVRVTISDPGNYQVAISQDPLNVPDDSKFINYASPTLPSVTFANLPAGAYYLYIKSSTTTCPTRTDAIMINGVTALADFEVLSNCSNVNLTINNIKGQQSQPFVIRVFGNDDKFFKIDSLVSSTIPLSNSVTFTYAPPQHTFLNSPATYRFVMVQTQTTGAGSCTLVSDTIVYQVRELLGITLGTVTPSFPNPKHTGSIEIANVTGGTRFVGTNNTLFYEISLTTADDDIIVKDWEKLGLDPQNKFVHLYDYLPPGVYRVKVRDAGGCIKTLDVEIPLETSIYVPNIFTPNNDGINDEFEVLNLPLTGSHKLIITNRWGNEVFTSGDYREGKFWNADNVSDGIYYYRLKVEGGEVYNGWVEIVRGQKP